jgi:peptide subunit release factor 1 (eRF1)
MLKDTRIIKPSDESLNQYCFLVIILDLRN